MQIQKLMKTFLILCSLLLATSEVQQDEAAESETIPEGDTGLPTMPEEDYSYTIVMTYMDGSINVTQSQQDAMNSYVSYIYNKNNENNELLSQYKTLLNQNYYIEAELTNSIVELVNQRVKEYKMLQGLSKEMEIIADFHSDVISTLYPVEDVEFISYYSVDHAYNHSSLNNAESNTNSNAPETDLSVTSETSTENTTEFNVDENYATVSNQSTVDNTTYVKIKNTTSSSTNSDLEISHGFIYVLGMSFIFLLLFTLKSASDELVYSAFKKSIYSLLLCLCVLTLMVSILSLLNYLDFISNDEFYLDTLYKGTALFAVLWMSMGIWMIFVCQGISIVWEAFEDRLCDGEVPAEGKDFAIMRKLFIANPYLPLASEYALRPDFNFAEYLKRCLGVNLKNIFTLNWIAFMLLISEVILWATILLQDKLVEYVFLWIIPFILLGISFVFMIKVKRIVKMLVPDEGEGLEIEYNYNSNVNIDLPKYLKGHIPAPDGDLLVCSTYALKLTCSYIFLGIYPNRHQLLFWLDIYGPKFIISIIQTVSFTLCLWLSLLILYFFENLFIYDLISAALIFIGIFMFFIIITYVIPLWIKYFTVATSIEMMKKHEVIKEVLENTQGSRMQRNSRLFVQFQSLWTDIQIHEGLEKLNNYSGHMQKLAKEAFELENKSGVIHYTKLNNILARLGIELEEDHFRVFLKDCEMEPNDTILLKGFMIGLQRLLKGQTVTEKKVVREVLKYHLKKNKASLGEIANFFEVNRWFMRDSDIKEFLIGLHFNLDKSDLVDIDEIEFNN